MCAFANFFFIINGNSPENEKFKDTDTYKEWRASKEPKDEDYHYVNGYTGNAVSNSMIAMWLLGLGEFDLDDSYSEGPNVMLCWFMFMLASFLVLTVFMNMLIAIMGETFSNVTAQYEESGLSEQLNMIQDSVWLLNLNDEFKNDKYIV